MPSASCKTCQPKVRYLSTMVMVHDTRASVHSARKCAGRGDLGDVRNTRAGNLLDSSSDGHILCHRALVHKLLVESPGMGVRQEI